MNPLVLASLSKIDINKIIIYAIVIVAFIISLRYIRKYLKSRKNQQIVNALEKDINVAKLSYPLSYYPIWAGELKSAISWYTTDEEAIYKIMGKLKTKHDVLQLISAFGVSDGDTLTQYIQGGMDDKERETMNRLLSDKNINYQF